MTTTTTILPESLLRRAKSVAERDVMPLGAFRDSVVYGIDVLAPVHLPRVKSGNLTGIEPLATDISLKGPGADQAAAS